MEVFIHVLHCLLLYLGTGATRCLGGLSLVVFLWHIFSFYIFVLLRFGFLSLSFVLRTFCISFFL